MVLVDGPIVRLPVKSDRIVQRSAADSTAIAPALLSHSNLSMPIPLPIAICTMLVILERTPIL